MNDGANDGRGAALPVIGSGGHVAGDLAFHSPFPIHDPLVTRRTRMNTAAGDAVCLSHC